MLNEDEDINLKVILTSSLLYPEYSNTLVEINKKYNVSEIEMLGYDRTTEGMARAFNNLNARATEMLSKNIPDMVILIADRFELLPICMAAAYLNIPICHIQAGEDSGNIDQKVRHGITMMSDIAFATNESALKRLQNMGVYGYNYGCPSIDLVKRVMEGK
jgi:UDP-N-acetylglucosamine 2-epimerase